MNKVYLIDNMEFMKDKPDNYYDLAIVDPPYGIQRAGQQETFTKKAKHKRKHHDIKQWDNNIPDKGYFSELFRISENQIIWGANYFVEHLTEGHMGWVFWYKGQQGLTMSDGEIAYSSFNKATRMININRGLIALDGSIHPTQKPIKLYKWLLKNYAKPNQTIFDSHVGSGSIRIACHDMGFDFEGCEIDADYWQAQEDRYNRHIKQSDLFGTDEIQKLIFKETP